MGTIENPLPEVDQEEHPLRILSQENLTVVSTFAGYFVFLAYFHDYYIFESIIIVILYRHL